MALHDKLPSPVAIFPVQDVDSSVPVDANTPSPSMTARDQTRSTVSKYLGGKEQEWKAVSERKGPLTLLELPVDILRLVVKEVCSPTPSQATAPCFLTLPL